jgi:redox-sensitive bicupin YhaK (pirin superfamily)
MPTYHQHEHEEFPQESHEGYKVKTVIGADAPVELVTDVEMWDVEVNHGAQYQHKVPAGYTLTALAIRGEGTWSESNASKPPVPFQHQDFIVAGYDSDNVVEIMNTGEAALRLILIKVPTTVNYPLYMKR